MSTLASVRVTCPRCGQPIEGEIAIFVRLDRRLDLKDAILARRLNVLRGACGHDVEIVRTVGIVDFARSWFVVCYPVWAEAHWEDLARATRDLFRKNFEGPAGRALPTAEWTVRVVFGYENLREKLVIWEGGLSEVAVECAKARVLAGRPDALGVALVLDAAGADTLAFRGYDAAGGVTAWHAPADLLGREPPPGLLPETLLVDPFVSARRWFVVPTQANPLAFDVEGAGVWPAEVTPRRQRDDTAD